MTFNWILLVLLVFSSLGAHASPANDPSRVTITPTSRTFLRDNLSTGSSGQASSPAPSPAFLEQRGGGLIPAGYHPMGYRITALGERFLEFGTSCLESDVGRLLASLKAKRKTMSSIQTEWLEIVRMSKSGQSMRIYRSLQELIDFCLSARLID